MWQQHRDVMFSPQGMAKAMQSGAKAKDLQTYATSCIQCGACDVLCPEKIPLTAWVDALTEDVDLPRQPHKKEEKLSGFVMSCDPVVQQKINQDDLYIIDAAYFHADYERRVEHYASLRTNTGCQINLDLNRMAIPTGVSSLAEKSGYFDVKQQIECLLHGREFERVLVENPMDMTVLREITEKEVIYIGDLMEKVIHATS